jgi:hypothetical protein
VIADYAGQAQGNLERVAQQFEQSPRRAVRLEGAIDPSRPAIIARCLDQIAWATERISGIAQEINLRTARF